MAYLTTRLRFPRQVLELRMHLSVSWNPTVIQPKGLQVLVLRVTSPKLYLWIPDFHRAFPCNGLGAKVGWTKKYNQIS